MEGKKKKEEEEEERKKVTSRSTEELVLKKSGDSKILSVILHPVFVYTLLPEYIHISSKCYSKQVVND